MSGRDGAPDADDAYTVDTRRGLARGRRTPAGRSPTPLPGPPQRRPVPGPPRHSSPPAPPLEPAPFSPSPTGTGSAYPPAAHGRGPAYGAPAPAPAGRRGRKRRRRTLVGLLLLALLAWAGFLVWVPLNAWSQVARVSNNPEGQRPVDTRGYNYLLVGSDSREGLTPQQQQELSTGPADGGKRTDSILLVHVSQSGGKPSIISIPRDSYVPIPGRGSNKINASYAFGGAKLLTETVEQLTGIHVDGYVEIGFGGFASIVDSLGGVDICVATDMQDPLAGINLKKGCQTLSGPQALGYVRSRYNDPRGDLGRADRQRQFLGAVMKKAVTPSTVLPPWRYQGFADAAAGGLTVGETTSLSDAVRVLQAMRSVSNGDGLSLTVPVENAAFQTRNAGVAVKLNTDQARTLFTMLRNDEPMSVPPAGTTVPG